MIRHRALTLLDQQTLVMEHTMEHRDGDIDQAIVVRTHLG